MTVTDFPDPDDAGQDVGAFDPADIVDNPPPPPEFSRADLERLWGVIADAPDTPDDERAEAQAEITKLRSDYVSSPDADPGAALGVLLGVGNIPDPQPVEQPAPTVDEARAAFIRWARGET